MRLLAPTDLQSVGRLITSGRERSNGFAIRWQFNYQRRERSNGFAIRWHINYQRRERSNGFAIRWQFNYQRIANPLERSLSKSQRVNRKRDLDPLLRRGIHGYIVPLP